MTYLSQTRKNSKVIQVVQREIMEKVKLFYKDAEGKSTHLIAEGEDVEIASKNAVKEYQILQEIYGEDKLPIKNITRMNLVVDN